MTEDIAAVGVYYVDVQDLKGGAVKFRRFVLFGLLCVCSYRFAVLEKFLILTIFPMPIARLMFLFPQQPIRKREKMWFLCLIAGFAG
jgi:hypothetical protein